MDSSDELPDPVQKLLHERVHSIEALEAVLVLRAAPARIYSAGELAEALRVNVAVAESAIQELVENGLCKAGPNSTRVSYDSPDAATGAALDQLAELYSERRMEVLVFISRLAISRVRTGALRVFAQAFRISEKKKDG